MSDGSGEVEMMDVSLEDNNAHGLGDAGMAELCGALGGVSEQP